jgi:uncharacterized protein (TIGR00369 family)
MVSFNHPRDKQLFRERTMSYLDRIKQDGRTANPFFCQMGIEVAEATGGRAVLKMEVRPDMHNGVGWLQGGLLVALADEAMALAVYSQLAEGEGIATISESTSFIKGVRNGVIFAEGRVIRKGRRVAFCESEVWTGGDERILLSRTSAAFAVTTKT